MFMEALPTSLRRPFEVVPYFSWTQTYWFRLITGSSPRPFKKHNLRQEIGIPKCSKKCVNPFFSAATTTCGTPFNLIMLRPEPLWLHNEHTPLAGPPGSHLVPVIADHTTTPGVKNPTSHSWNSWLVVVLSQETEWNCTLSACGGSPQGTRVEVNSKINHKITIIINLSGSRFTSFDPNWPIPGDDVVQT